jgi:competence protein ComEA
MKQMLLFVCMIVLAIGIDFRHADFKALQKDTITVTVQGEVEQPGSVEVPLYATIDDVLRKVQPQEDADLSSLNLQTVLKDHDVVTVPRKEEIRKISINTATAEELAELPGIGPSTAERITAYREENGLFQTIEDLMRVKGIGQNKFDRLKDRIQL